MHKIVFNLVDKICDAFETDAFYAGTDEVCLGDDKRPHCSGRDKNLHPIGDIHAGSLKKQQNP